jgi:hypothetical protein
MKDARVGLFADCDGERASLRVTFSLEVLSACTTGVHQLGRQNARWGSL